MKRTTTQNGKGRNGDGKINAISFSELSAGPQVYLRNKSLLLPVDPQYLSDDEIEEHRGEFLYQFPSLEETVTDTKVMRRLMKFAFRAGRRHMAQMKSGRSMAPTSL